MQSPSLHLYSSELIILLGNWCGFSHFVYVGKTDFSIRVSPIRYPDCNFSFTMACEISWDIGATILNANDCGL